MIPIPLRDVNPSRRFPAWTVGLIAANVAAFLYELRMDSRGDLKPFIDVYGLIPSSLVESLKRGHDLRPIAAVFTSMFLHGGWGHLIGNLWFLWIFGDNIEDRLGRAVFPAFYLACGIGAAAVHTTYEPRSALPMVGASGAISGVLGGYLILYPKARVWCLVFLGYYSRLGAIPAWLFLGVWFAFQALMGYAEAAARRGSDPAAGGVAFWAHIGGFVVGAVLVALLPARKEASSPP